MTSRQLRAQACIRKPQSKLRAENSIGGSGTVRKPSLLVVQVQKKAASGVADAAVANAIADGLEREIYARAGHAEVAIAPVHKIPAEITDPADMRRKANFQTAAHLAQCLGLAICITNRAD